MQLSRLNHLRHISCATPFAPCYTPQDTLFEARDKMGHSDIRTTANIYTHLDKLEGRKTKGKITKCLCKYAASKSDVEMEKNRT